MNKPKQKKLNGLVISMMVWIGEMILLTVVMSRKKDHTKEFIESSQLSLLKHSWNFQCAAFEDPYKTVAVHFGGEKREGVVEEGGVGGVKVRQGTRGEEERDAARIARNQPVSNPVSKRACWGTYLQVEDDEEEGARPETPH